MSKNVLTEVAQIGGHFAYTFTIRLYNRETNKYQNWTEYHCSMMTVSARIAFFAGDSGMEVVRVSSRQIWIQAS